MAKPNPAFDFAKQCLKSTFGGNQRSNPKVARPISTKDDMHVVLKSSLAKGRLSFAHHERSIVDSAHRLGPKVGVQIKDIVVMHNHIHLHIRVLKRRSFAAFVSALSGLIARRVLGAERGKPSGVSKFFEGRPFSRIIAAGKKSYKVIRDYFKLNRLEKRGYSKAKSRKWGLVDDAVWQV